jgi:hypothetical protein
MQAFLLLNALAFSLYAAATAHAGTVLPDSYLCYEQKQPIDPAHFTYAVKNVTRNPTIFFYGDLTTKNSSSHEDGKSIYEALDTALGQTSLRRLEILDAADDQGFHAGAFSYDYKSGEELPVKVRCAREPATVVIESVRGEKGADFADLVQRAAYLDCKTPAEPADALVVKFRPNFNDQPFFEGTQAFRCRY